MGYTQHQLEYWTPICGDCVLHTSIANCYRLDDMSTRNDSTHARRGCLLAFARLNGIEPRFAGEVVRVHWDKQAGGSKPKMVFMLDGEFKADSNGTAGEDEADEM